MKKWKIALAAGSLVATGAWSDQAGLLDFGVKVEKLMESLSMKLFGVKKALEKSAEPVPLPYRTPDQAASEQILLAKGLNAAYRTREAGDAIDQMDFYPNAEYPQYLMACIEGSRTAIGTLPGGITKYNPSVQRIHLLTGAVTTILRGITRCDGLRTTPWGTVIATEEASDGGVYEILNPAVSENLTVVDRSTGEIVDAGGAPTDQASKMSALATIAYEGLGLTPAGVLYGGDELQPGSGTPDADGGALFKFVPAVPHQGGNISSLDQSPLSAGKVYALRVSCTGGQQYGQGCEVGHASWVEVSAADSRSDAGAAGATGYYRPEDGHIDPAYSDSANPGAVRFCWTNTQSESAHSFGEVLCAADQTPLTADATKNTTVVTRFIQGDRRFNSFDNFDFQPWTRNSFVIEDHRNGDIFSCLPDGADRDLQTDGCAHIASVVDPSSEPTGWLFTADGKTAYVAVQHTNDANMPLVDDYRTDDLLVITGFKVPSRGAENPDGPDE